MGPRGRFTHVGIILSTVYGSKWSYCIYWNVWDRICRYCIWVELPVQRDSARFSEVASGNPTSTCIPRVDG